MNRILTCLVTLLTICSSLYAQPDLNLVRAGTVLHDEGRFNEAIAKYDSALAVNPDSYHAYFEKSYSLSSLGQYEQSNSIITMMLKKFPVNDDNAMLYCSYGNNFDMLKKPKKALEAYEEGIEKYPAMALLRFNKGITYFNMGDNARSREAICQSITLNPFHASSHNALRKLVSDNQVFSLMATLFFLTLESEGQRAEAAYSDVQKTMRANVSTIPGTNNTEIRIVLPSTDKNPRPDDFHMAEMILGLNESLNKEATFANESKTDRLKRNLTPVFNTLSDKKSMSGFGWEFYAPFYTALKDSEHFDTWIHLVSYSSGDPVNRAWIAANDTRVRDLSAWFSKYFKEIE